VAGEVTTGLFVVTGVPALVLAGISRAPKTALILALAFPALLLVLFMAVMIALP
jgi:hypothetical protein